MGLVGVLFVRLGCSVGAFFLFVLIFLIIWEPSLGVLLTWPVWAAYGLMLYGWYGVLFLAAGSYAADRLLRVLLDRTEGLSRYRWAIFVAGDLAAGAAVSRICYARNDFFFYCGCAITVLFTLLYRWIERLPHAKLNTPTAD